MDRTVLFPPGVMEFCQTIWPMGHGKKVAEWARPMEYPIYVTTDLIIIQGCELDRSQVRKHGACAFSHMSLLHLTNLLVTHHCMA